MRERDVEQLLVDAVKKSGGKAYKFVSPGNAGVPDRVVCLPGGRVVFVELKAEGGRLSKIQDAQIRLLRQMGQAVEVVTGPDGVHAFFEKYLVRAFRENYLAKGGDENEI